MSAVVARHAFNHSAPPPPPVSARWLGYASRYVSLTFGYGALRALTYNYEDEREYYNTATRKFETKPMLWCDNAVRVFLQSASAVTVWPAMLCADLRRLECYARGLDRAAYSAQRRD